MLPFSPFPCGQWRRIKRAAPKELLFERSALLGALPPTSRSAPVFAGVAESCSGKILTPQRLALLQRRSPLGHRASRRHQQALVGSRSLLPLLPPASRGCRRSGAGPAAAPRRAQAARSRGGSAPAGRVAPGPVLFKGQITHPGCSKERLQPRCANAVRAHMRRSARRSDPLPRVGMCAPSGARTCTRTLRSHWGCVGTRTDAVC